MPATSLDATLVNSFKERGGNADHIWWAAPIKRAVLRSGEHWDSGYCLATEDDELFLFPPQEFDAMKLATGLLQMFQRKTNERSASSPEETAQQAAFDLPSLERRIGEQDGRPTLAFGFPPGAPFDSVELLLNEAGLAGVFGEWTTPWEAALHSRFKTVPSFKFDTVTEKPESVWPKIGAVSISLQVPKQHDFGAKTARDFPLLFCCWGDGQLKSFPTVELPPLKPLKWQRTETGLDLLIDRGGVPNLVGIQEIPINGERPFVAELEATLSPETASSTVAEEFACYGLFDIQTEEETSPFVGALKKTELGVRLAKGVAETTIFSEGFSTGSGVILVARKGTWARVSLSAEEQKNLLQALGAPVRGTTNSDGSFTALVISEESGFTLPVHLTISGAKIATSADWSAPLEAEGELQVSMPMSGNCFLTFSPVDAKLQPLKVAAPEALANEIRVEWEVRRAQERTSKASLAELYNEFNDAKKSNLLAALFSDVILLNRKLGEGIPMDELIEHLEVKGAAEFSKDKEMQEATVSKILLLIMMLPQIKQKFELLATMYPYYWVHHESRWLENAFGVDVKSKTVEAENRRVIPAVRREVRSIQNNIQRALMEIESAARSLDALLAKKEASSHWQAKARKFVPMGLQGLFAGGLIVFSGGTNPVAWNMLGNFLASGVLGNLCATMLEDMEAVTQIQRASKSIFPWWQVFMRTLIVSIYEAGQFIDTQNISSMQRDRKLLDEAKGPEREATIRRMEKALQQRIIEEKKNRFTEIFHGSSIRLATVVDDIQFAIGKSMEREIDDFVQSMTFGAQKLAQE